MKNIILFGTKYGFAKDCAEDLAQKLNGGAKLVNLMEDKAPSLDGYENVIIGGSVYAGQFQRQVKSFVNENQSALMAKNLALFLCAGSEENMEANFATAIPKEIVDKAFVKGYFGGEFRFERMGFFSKMIIKMVSKASDKEGKPKSLPSKLPSNIDTFARAVNDKS